MSGPWLAANRSGKKESDLFSYQLKLVVAENKLDEFIDSLRFLSRGIRNEQGCLDFSLYQDFQQKNAYRVQGEWKTRQAMEAHFKQEKFAVLIGAARVLGEDFEMSIGQTLEKGRYQFAQEKIALDPVKGRRRDTDADR